MGMGVLLLALPGAWADPSGTNGIPVTEVSTRRPASETEEWGSVRFTNDYASPGFLWGRAFVTARGLPASKDKYRFEVWNVADGSLIGPQEFVRDGVFDAGVLVVPGKKPGETGHFIFRAWEVLSDRGYVDASLRVQILISVNLGGGTRPPSGLEESNFFGTDLWPWWWDGSGLPLWPPEPSREFNIQRTEDGSIEISAVCPQISRKQYFIAASRNMRDWEMVAELGLRLSTEDRLVKWKVPNPELGPVFYRVIP